MSLLFRFSSSSSSSSSVVNKTPLGHETLRTRVKPLFCDGHLVSDKDVLTVCWDKGARWVDAGGLGQCLDQMAASADWRPGRCAELPEHGVDSRAAV